MRQEDMQGSCLFVLFCFITREECCFFSVLLMFTKETEGDMRAWACILKLIDWVSKMSPLETSFPENKARVHSHKRFEMQHSPWVWCLEPPFICAVVWELMRAFLWVSRNSVLVSPKLWMQKLCFRKWKPQQRLQADRPFLLGHSRLRSLLYLPHCLLIFVYLYILY